MGTNSFHGSAFAYVQDASLSQKNYFVEKNVSFRQARVKRDAA